MATRLCSLRNVIQKLRRRGAHTARGGEEGGPVTQRSFDVWQRAIRDLTALYRGIERQSLELPTLSLSPLFAGARGVVRFAVSPVCDAVRLTAASIRWGRTRSWQCSC